MDDDRTHNPRDDDELTVKEAAAYLHLMITRVLRLCEAGTFGREVMTPDGPDFRIRRADLDAYAAQLQAAAGAEQANRPRWQDDVPPNNGNTAQ